VLHVGGVPWVPGDGELWIGGRDREAVVKGRRLAMEGKEKRERCLLLVPSEEDKGSLV
jgi:hypothetical protein